MCECEGNSKLGNYLGKIGSQVGDRTQAWGENLLSSAAKRFKNWSGLGDYQLRANSLITGAPMNDKLAVRVDGRTTIVRYKEYLGDISLSATGVGMFNATTFVVNPGNFVTFPWLSNIALQYDQYIPLGIIFEFVSTATDSATTGALGSVIIASEYDVTDADYNSKQQMLQSAYAMEAKMSDNMAHGIECDPSETSRKVFYTRGDGTGTGLNLKDYDICKTTIATQGGTMPVGTIVGSFYVHYEFAFMKEQIYGGLSAKGLLYQNNIAGSSTLVDPILGSFPWTFAAGRLLGIQAISVVGSPYNIITFNRKLLGACVRIEIWYTDSGTFTVGSGPLTQVTGYNVGTTVLDTGTGLGPGAAIPAGKWGMFESCSSFGGTLTGVFASVVVKLDSTLPPGTDVASFSWENSGVGLLFPTGSRTGAKGAIRYTIVPESYFSYA